MIVSCIYDVQIAKHTYINNLNTHYEKILLIEIMTQLRLFQHSKLVLYVTHTMNMYNNKCWPYKRRAYSVSESIRMELEKSIRP